MNDGGDGSSVLIFVSCLYILSELRPTSDIEQTVAGAGTAFFAAQPSWE
jgi:hypothetical protein